LVRSFALRHTCSDQFGLSRTSQDHHGVLLHPVPTTYLLTTAALPDPVKQWCDGDRKADWYFNEFIFVIRTLNNELKERDPIGIARFAPVHRGVHRTYEAAVMQLLPRRW
jgi:hypothetical protein